MDLRKQFKLRKYLFIFSLIIINGLLIFLLVYFDNSWIQYLILSLIFIQIAYLTIELLLIMSFYIVKKIKILMKPKNVINIQNKAMVMTIPCYNQEIEELLLTINSYLKQQNIEKIKKIMFIVVDGKIKTKNQKININSNTRPINNPAANIVTAKTFASSMQLINYQNTLNNPNNTQNNNINQPITTNTLLKQLFKETITKSTFYNQAYMCWKKTWIGVQVYDGIYQGLPYLVVVKDQNCTKRDSLALVYKSLYHLSGQQPIDPKYYNPQFIQHIAQIFKKYGINKFDYMMTTDADSQPSQNAAYDMIQELERKQNIFGVTGQVQVRFSQSKCNILQLTQFQQYISSQSVIRFQQKLTSQKIHCLPGALNIIRVCKETCGKAVLDDYRFISDTTTSLLEYIKNSASQDRHHIMIMFGHYGYAKTSMTYDAIVKTSVPVTISHFLSQRKRWNLGTVTHNIWMTFIVSNIPFWQRISSFVVILQFILLPTLMYCFGRFIVLLVKFGKGQLLQLSAYFITLLVLGGFRMIFMFCIGFFTPGLQCKHRILYTILLIPFIFILNPIRAFCCFLYNIYHLDDFNWIRGQQILKVQSMNKINNNKQINNDSNNKINDKQINNIYTSYTSMNDLQSPNLQIKRQQFDILP